jgi:hypothetical protein
VGHKLSSFWQRASLQNCIRPKRSAPRDRSLVVWTMTNSNTATSKDLFILHSASLILYITHHGGLFIRYYRYGPPLHSPKPGADPLTGKDFVLLASDQSAGRSIIKMKSDENKIRTLGPSLAMAFGGEPGEWYDAWRRRGADCFAGDTNNFVDYVERNLRLYQIRYVYPPVICHIH